VLRGGTRAHPVAVLGALLALGWLISIGGALGLRIWNALEGAPLSGYDAWGHIAYVLFLDVYGALPWADQGWSYFHPPLRYAMGWLLAQLGSSDALLRGLALLGSAESLATAALAAWVTRLSLPERSALPLLAFTAVAFVPVHLYVSPMVGNEMTSALWSSVTITALILNERREVPRLSGDALTGLAAGLALLAKFSGVLALATALAVPLLRGLGSGEGVQRRLMRVLVVGVAAGLLAGPVYLRNAIEFGTPFRMSRVDPLVADVERDQPPGERSWRDFVSISTELLTNPDPRADHLLHSVWGTLYVNAWTDTRRLRDDGSAPSGDRIARARAMMALGIVPIALALLGAAAFLVDLRRGRRRAAALPLLVSCVLTFASVVVFAIQVPTYAALKASYLLGLSVPYGVFIARATALLAGRSRWLAVGAAVGVALAAGASILSERAGSLVEPPVESWLIGPVQMHFGEHDRAIALFQNLMRRKRLLAGSMSENVAAAELAAGRPERALEIYRRLEARGISDPWSANQFAVASALLGDYDTAQHWLDVSLERGAGAIALTNRGAVRLATGDLRGAETDLRAAIDTNARLAPAWWLLAEVNERAGRAQAASDARERASREARGAPRGPAHGFGAPLGVSPAPRLDFRWLLKSRGDSVELAAPPYRRDS
jgi:tetratricopeptide (TPR) repeat protein